MASHSSCLEWRYTLPLLEEAGLETWAIDILGWGFSDLSMSSPSSFLWLSEFLKFLVNFFIVYVILVV